MINLDSGIRDDWQQSLEGSQEGAQVFPTYQTLVNFLTNRTHSMDTAQCAGSRPGSGEEVKSKVTSSTKARSSSGKFVSADHAVGPTPRRPEAKTQCPLYPGGHFVGYCPKFLRKDASQRQGSIRTLRLCVNCLRTGHTLVDCLSKHRCSYCGGLHHSNTSRDSPHSTDRSQAEVQPN